MVLVVGCAQSDDAGANAADDTSSTETSAATGDGDGDGDGDGQGPPEPECSETSCGTKCVLTFDCPEDVGGTCSTDVKPSDYESCSFPTKCSGAYKGLCAAQMLRYGVYGLISYEQSGDLGDYRGRFIEVFGDGRARSRYHAWAGYCCGYTNSHETESYGHPQYVIDSDAAHWDTCIATYAEAPEVYDSDWYDDAEPHPCLFGWAEQCAGAALTDCPAKPPSVSGCEDCPMVGDGICDESPGTGLCGPGCDPVDCTCETDQPGVCDEPQNGGTCPYGSDPDCWD